MNINFKFLKRSTILVFILLIDVLLFTSITHAMSCVDLFHAKIEVTRLSEHTQEDKVSAIEPGSVVEFSDGVAFEIKKIISISNTDGIFQLENGQVLRVHKYGGETINQYLDGYKYLVSANIPVPRIIEFRRGERIVVEKIEIQLHLEDLFLERSTLSPQFVEKIKNEFMIFVTRFRNFNQVGDFHAGQIVYAKNRGWMLLDWQNAHKFGNRVNPFNPVWSTIEVIAEQRQLTFDRGMVKRWKLESDSAIAFARRQSPKVYHDMTFEEILELLYAN